ncbi:unnamed protein product, partial [Mesorhabditis spiculigera]
MYFLYYCILLFYGYTEACIRIAPLEEALLAFQREPAKPQGASSALKPLARVSTFENPPPMPSPAEYEEWESVEENEDRAEKREGKKVETKVDAQKDELPESSLSSKEIDEVLNEIKREENQPKSTKGRRKPAKNSPNPANDELRKAVTEANKPKKNIKKRKRDKKKKKKPAVTKTEKNKSIKIDENSNATEIGESAKLPPIHDLESFLANINSMPKFEENRAGYAGPQHDGKFCDLLPLTMSCPRGIQRCAGGMPMNMEMDGADAFCEHTFSNLTTYVGSSESWHPVHRIRCVDGVWRTVDRLHPKNSLILLRDNDLVTCV